MSIRRNDEGVPSARTGDGGGMLCASCGAQHPGLRFCTQCGWPVGLPELTLTPAPTGQVEPGAADVDADGGWVQPAGVRPPVASGRLPRVQPRGGARTLHWVGVHGGAGETTLALAMPGSVAAGHGWPVEPSGPGGSPIPVPVVLVARSHGTGMVAAQDALREWATGAAAPTRLLGLVVIADSPARLPKELATMRRLLAGGAPKFWTIPYVDELRLGHDSISIATLNPEINKVRRSIQALIDHQ